MNTASLSQTEYIVTHIVTEYYYEVALKVYNPKWRAPDWINMKHLILQAS